MDVAQRIGLPVSREGGKSLETVRNMGCVFLCETARGGVVQRLPFLSLEHEQNWRPLVLSQAPVCTDGLSDSTDVQIYEKEKKGLMMPRWCLRAGWNVLVGDCYSHAPLHSSFRSQTRFFSYYLFFLPFPLLMQRPGRSASALPVTWVGGEGDSRALLHTHTHSCPVPLACSPWAFTLLSKRQWHHVHCPLDNCEATWPISCQSSSDYPFINVFVQQDIYSSSFRGTL